MKPLVQMTEEHRLRCIKLAVDYAHEARSLGMPNSTWAKAVREPIFFLWEKWGKKKHEAAKYCSVSIDLPLSCSGGLVYDHAYPINLLIEELLNSDRSISSIKKILSEKTVAVLITPEEDSKLTKAGYRSKLPEGVDFSKWKERYSAVGIDIKPISF